MKGVILGSGSPRRLNILKKDFPGVEVIIADKDEKYFVRKPEKIVTELALLKLGGVIEKCLDKNRAIITADTIVWHDGRVLGKPGYYEEAKEILKSLSDKTHYVYTGFAVFNGELTLVGYERSEVRMKALDEELIDTYIATGSPFDKAGGYGIQDKVLVESYKGDYDNIVGLPKRAVKALKELVKF